MTWRAKGQNLAQNNVTVGTTATLIRPANPRRLRIHLQNVNKENKVYVGNGNVEVGKSVMIANGDDGAATEVHHGHTIVLETQGAIYGIADPAEQGIRYLEELM